jgi:hypothetical protein
MGSKVNLFDARAEKIAAISLDRLVCYAVIPINIIEINIGIAFGPQFASIECNCAR